MAEIILSAVKTGITRLRTKGGASPDSLFDLANAYVSAARTIVPRPGSAISQNLPEGTIGLGLFNGVFQVFSDHVVAGLPENYNLNILSHPDPDPDDPPTLIRIWKKEAFMGGLYVVAEWSDDRDRAFHYWVRSVGAGTWKANTVMMLGDIVAPTTPNGLTYVAARLNPPDPVWVKDEEREVGEIVEPTTYNGYKYVCIEASGDPARSGSVEPDWIAEEGALVIEEVDLGGETGGNNTPPIEPPPGPGGGYNNPGGGGPINTTGRTIEK